MIEIHAKLPDGKEKTYTIEQPTDKGLQNIISTAEENDIYLTMYFVRLNGQKTKIFDSLFLQMAAEVVRDNL